MRAVWMREYGAPSVLVVGEAPDPVPGEGEVLINVRIAGVTFVETQMRAGRAPAPGPPLPTIPGNGVGGVIAAVGPGVDDRLLGRRVVTSTGGRGGYAERVVVRLSEVIAVPSALDLADAVAVFADGRTAIGLTRLARPGPGEFVLVEAAGGGVGSLLVQLASAAGARVIAAASSRRKRALAQDLGAYATVDYTRPEWPDLVRAIIAEAPAGSVSVASGRAGAVGLDVVFDSVGGVIGRAAFELMAPGGRFVISGVSSGSMTDTTPLPAQRDRRVRVFGIENLAALAAARKELTAAALAEAAAARLHPVIGQTFPLAQAAFAHAAIEARTTMGKTLLICGRPARVSPGRWVAGGCAARAGEHSTHSRRSRRGRSAQRGSAPGWSEGGERGAGPGPAACRESGRSG